MKSPVHFCTKHGLWGLFNSAVRFYYQYSSVLPCSYNRFNYYVELLTFCPPYISSRATSLDWAKRVHTHANLVLFIHSSMFTPLTSLDVRRPHSKCVSTSVFIYGRMKTFWLWGRGADLLYCLFLFC